MNKHQMEKDPLQHIKNTGYKVPEGFFEDFEDKVMRELQNRETPVFSLKKYVWVSAIAASLVLFISLFSIHKKHPIETDTIIGWMDYNEDLDAYDIAEVFPDEMDAIHFDEKTDTQEIEDYLEDTLTEDNFY